MKKIIKWVLITVAFLFVVGIFTSPNAENSNNINDSTTVECIDENATENTTESTTKVFEEESTTIPETTPKESITEEIKTEITTKEITTQKETTTIKETETTSKKVTTTQKETSTKQFVETTNRIETTTKKVTTTVDPDSQVTVYVTQTGKRYHYENPCGNGTYYPSTLANAKARGLTACDKCVLH